MLHVCSHARRHQAGGQNGWRGEVAMSRLLQLDDRAVSRRFLLQAGLAFGGGLALSWAWPGQSAWADQDTPNTGDGGFALNAFLIVRPDGKVTVISPSVEMGQGTYTALPMLVADELDVDMKDVSVDHAPPDDKLYGNPQTFNVQ